MMLSEKVCQNKLNKRIKEMYPDKLDDIAFYIDHIDVVEYQFRYEVDGRRENLSIDRATGDIKVERIIVS